MIKPLPPTSPHAETTFMSPTWSVSCIIPVPKEVWREEQCPCVSPYTPVPHTCPSRLHDTTVCCKYCCTVCNYQIIPLSKAPPAAPSHSWVRPGNPEGEPFEESFRVISVWDAIVYSCKIAFLSKEWCYLKNKQKTQKTRIANKFLNNVSWFNCYLPSSISLLFSCFLLVMKPES
jgi:hypothetical protein